MHGWFARLPSPNALAWQKEKTVEGVFTGHSLNRHMVPGQILRLNLSFPAAVSHCIVAVRVSSSLVLLPRLCSDVGIEGPQGFLA
jgi:hypothetical protein